MHGRERPGPINEFPELGDLDAASAFAAWGSTSKSVKSPPLKVLSRRSADASPGSVTVMSPFTVFSNDADRGVPANVAATAPFTVVARPDPLRRSSVTPPLTLSTSKSPAVPSTRTPEPLTVHTRTRVSRGTRIVKSTVTS